MFFLFVCVFLSGKRENRGEREDNFYDIQYMDCGFVKQFSEFQEYLRLSFDWNTHEIKGKIITEE